MYLEQASALLGKISAPYNSNIWLNHIEPPMNANVIFEINIKFKIIILLSLFNAKIYQISRRKGIDCTYNKFNLIMLSK